MNIHDYDNQMDNTRFLSKVDNIFILLMSGVMFDELENVKHKVNSYVYDRFSTICFNNRTRGFSQMYDELSVKSTNILDIREKDDKLVVTVELISGYIDYQINNNNGNIDGDNKTKNFHKYILTLEKRLDALGVSVSMHCPTCGRPINYNADGTCDFCGTVFNTEKFDYILTDIKKVRL